MNAGGRSVNTVFAGLLLAAVPSCGGSGGTQSADYCIFIAAGDPANPDCPSRAAMSARLVGTDVDGGKVLSVDAEPSKAVTSDPRLISCCYRITREKSR